MTTFHWKKAVSGNFNTAANWTPTGVPGSADGAIIDAVGTYTVSSSQNNTVEELDTIGTATLAVDADTFEVKTIINNYGTVSVHDGATFKVDIPLVINPGKIALGGANTTTTFDMPTGGFLAGSGQITLSDSANNVVTGAGMLTNHDNTVSGAGVIDPGALINAPAGVIDGSGTHNALVIDTGSLVTNLGVLESTGAGGLDIKDTVRNFDGIDPDGLIQASGAGHVDLDDGAFEGGVFATSGSGKIDTKSGAVGTIENVLNTGLFVISDNSTLQVEGDIINTGTFKVNAAAHSARIELISTDTDFSGMGNITLTDSSQNLIYASVHSLLTNIDDTISGAGTIGVDSDLTLDNGGVIDASGKVNKLLLETPGNNITNTGTIELTNTGGLEFLANVDNENGTVIDKAGSGFGLLVARSGITGGAEAAAVTGAVITLSDGSLFGDVSTVAGSTITTGAETNNAINAVAPLGRTVIEPPVTTANAGKIVVVDDSDLDLGGIVANSGTIAVNASGHATTLEINGTTLTGKGKLTLTNNANNAITSDQAPGAVVDADFSGSIGGTIHAGDVITATFTLQSVTTSVSYVATGTTAASVAAGLAAAINANAALAALDISADAISGNSIFTIKRPGLGGNSTAVSFSTNGSETLPASGDLVGGAGAMENLVNVDNTISGAGVIGDFNPNLVLTNDFNGTINANGTHQLEIATSDATVINNGTLESTAAGGLHIEGELDSPGALKVSAGTLEVDGAASGGGKATISGKGILELEAPQNSLNVDFASGSTGQLKLVTTAVGNAAGGLDPGLVLQGTIFGFGANTTQSIDLVGVEIASVNKSYSGNNAGGTLTVSDSAGDSVELNFAGTYNAGNFTLKNDGIGGTLITDPRDATAPANSANIPLFGSYIASAFAAGGHGSALLSEGLAGQPQPLLSLPHG